MTHAKTYIQGFLYYTSQIIIAVTIYDINTVIKHAKSVILLQYKIANVLYKHSYPHNSLLFEIMSWQLSLSSKNLMSKHQYSCETNLVDPTTHPYHPPPDGSSSFKWLFRCTGTTRAWEIPSNKKQLKEKTPQVWKERFFSKIYN